MSLPPIWGNLLERLIYNIVFKHLIDINFRYKNQPGFKPPDSCINQLLSITRDKGIEIRVFPLMSQKHLINYGGKYVYLSHLS